jgi:putative GTP pyrophosphokinase
MSVSRTQVDRAGILLRNWWRTPTGGEEEAEFDEADLSEAVGIVSEYRTGFQGPLKKVTVGLRQFVERESSEIVVGQRLKRTPQILHKLSRFGSMRLTQMEDIAGCRAILPGGASEAGGVLRRIRRNWDIVGIDDYIASPKSTGYRAIHVVVRRDGHPVEIQIRTPGQHEWAEGVERLAARTGFPLKDGEGPPELLTYLELVGWAISVEERGEDLDEGFTQALLQLKDRVDHYFSGPR